MSTKGQTINDRINAAKYTLAGQALARCICKATTEELMRPKKKHLDYLAACTYESNVSMLQLANMLIERTNHSNWAVVYKSLITVHHLMTFGSERFTQYLASSNYSFQLSGFLDRIVAKGYAMSTFIRRYSNYINQKALSYRTLAVDLCKTPKGGDNILRTMPIQRLLETLPIIQKQLDVLLDFGCTSNDLSNSIITASFTLLFHDSIRLFASYNDGIINLFEKYFDLNKKMCREAFEAYKKFLACTDRVAEFLKVGEAINLDRGEIPDFKRAPSSLLDALEQHLISLENNKKRGDNKVVIDTKLATFPSFSANTRNSLDFSPPPIAKMATEFDTSLSFTDDSNDEKKQKQQLDDDNDDEEEIDDFEKAVRKITSNSFNIDNNSTGLTINCETTTSISNSNDNNNNNDITTLTSNSDSLSEIVIQPPTSSLSLKNQISAISTNNDNKNPLDLASDFDAQLSSATINNIDHDSAFAPTTQFNKNNNNNTTTSTSTSISMSANANATATGSVIKKASDDLFDIKPPGYLGGSLLTPEPTLQCRIDPSIDPHTQQQLIQIQREQAANKYKYQSSGSGNNSIGNRLTSNNSNNNYSSTRSTSSQGKAKHESIFEDLEQTMRQSLQKVEKA